MSTEFVIKAEMREDQGKGASRRLRRDGKFPAIVYGAGKQPQPLMLAHHTVLHQLENEAFYSHILTVEIANGPTEKVVLRDIQRHPYKPAILHMDLQRVSENEKIRVHVPLHFVNDDICRGVKQGGQISHLMVEVEVQCLPRDLPEFIAIDLENVDVGQTIHLTELTLPAGVEIVALTHGGEHDQAVVNVHKPGGGLQDEAAEALPGA
ncbi:MAG: 50S ribosomal protein L25/general stress protein Ctc [Thiotrichales bacterium]